MLPKSRLRFVLTTGISEAELTPACLAHTGAKQIRPDPGGDFGPAPTDIVIRGQGRR